MEIEFSRKKTEIAQIKITMKKKSSKILTKIMRPCKFMQCQHRCFHPSTFPPYNHNSKIKSKCKRLVLH